MAAMSENDLIARCFAPWAGEGAFGLKDDAAALTPPEGCELVLTKDALVAGVHFFADDPPEAVAKKALRVNLSDLAAKGATPLGFLLALALPKGWTGEWLAAFAQGLREDSQAYACPLLGGDTVRTPGPLTLSITALGATSKGGMVKRFAAHPGDRLFVTGTIGDAALGLRCRLRDPALDALAPAARAYLEERYLLPRPRLAAVAAMRACAGAGMDVSDGFIGDLTKMMRASGCGARVELSAVPLSDAALAAKALDPDAWERALTGGDDYELLAAVAPHQAGNFQRAMEAARVPAACVGEVVAGAEIVFLSADGVPRLFERGSFQHF
jgi:thiamine-monophosphate kinase